MRPSVVLLCGVLLCGVMVSAPLTGRGLVIMGWDGAGLTNVNRLLSEGRLPGLRRLLDSEGGALVPVELVTAVITGPVWVSAFTGFTYDQTGLLGQRHLETWYGGEVNTTYDQATGIYVGMDFWFDPVPSERTIMGQVQALGHSLGWFTSKEFEAFEDLLPDDSLFSRPTDDEGTYMDELGERTLAFLAAHPDDFLVFFHVDPDFYGHIHGEDGPRYEEEFLRADEWLDRLLDAIDPATTAIVVMADHGFDEGEHRHRNADDAWLVTNLPVDRAYFQRPKQRAFATMRDVAPTILEWFGIDWQALHPPIRAKSLLESAPALSHSQEP